MKNISIQYQNEEYAEQLRPGYVNKTQFQLHSFNMDTITIRPKQSAKVNTGVSIYIPHTNLCGLITVHPVIATSGAVIHQANMILPAQYKNMISLRIENNHPSAMLEIKKFTPIAVVTLMPTEKGRFTKADEFKPAGKNED